VTKIKKQLLFEKSIGKANVLVKGKKRSQYTTRRESKEEKKMWIML